MKVRDSALLQRERAFEKDPILRLRKSERAGFGMIEAIEPEAELFTVADQVDLAEKAFHDALVRRNSAQITLSLLDQISVCVLSADQEPGALEGDVLDFIRQWTAEVPTTRLNDYRVILKAVDALNLYIDKGELRVIIGPNGAGKTTVLDLICGRTKVSDGSIKFKDQEITGRKEQEIVRLGIGRKFQTPTIYEDLSVFENLELSIPRGRNVAGALFWKRTEEVNERVKDVAAMIFLRDHLDQAAETLSHGQKQWLEIGMLLIQDPELLMLDEPVAGMSVSERVKTAALLNEIIKNRSVIVIEHDMKFVASIAHRVTVLHQGKVLAEGDMRSVQNNPKVKEVYLGH